MEFISIMISLGAFSIAAISLIWQLQTHSADLKVEFVRVYKKVADLGPQYIFRFHFINNSPTPISVSRIVIKNGENSITVTPEKLRLIEKIYKSTSSQNVDGKIITTETITDRGRLYSHELPFRIDGSGAEGGNFYLLDRKDKLTIEDEKN